MKALLIFILTSFAYAAPSLVSVRELYKKAAQDEVYCEEMLQVLNPYTERNNPLLAGYKGCATMVMAKHTANPFTRMSYFSEGKTILEKSIAADRNNVELRFLRFAVQTKAPSFLNYKGAINDDKQLISGAFAKITDTHLKQLIASFMQKSEVLTAQEKKMFTLTR